MRRLLSALKDLEAHFLGTGQRRLGPKLSHLRTAGHQLLVTRAGPLDLVREIGLGRGYPELISETTELRIKRGLRIRLLNLDTLIQTKIESARDKDKAVIAILQRTLKEKSSM